MGSSLHNLVVWVALCSFVKAYPEVPINGTLPWTIVEPGWVPEPSIRGTLGCGSLGYFASQGIAKLFCDSKIKLCLIAVLAPELLPYWAVAEYTYAKDWTNTITDMKKGQLKCSQTFFVSMGGVQLDFADGTKVLGEDNYGEFNSYYAMDHFGQALSSNLFTIDTISVVEVEGRAKTNRILKAIVCFQASWLVIQVIGRALAKLPISTLEVVTVGYVACALITYAAWWHKPQDPEVHIKLDFKTMTEAEFYQRLYTIDEISQSDPSLWILISSFITPLVFGAVHCIAWNFYFASYAESVIWKVAIILTVVLPLPVIPFLPIVNFEYLRESPRWYTFAITYALTYALVRLYLMVEPFVAFRRVPQGIFYTVNWAKRIPHI